VRASTTELDFDIWAHLNKEPAYITTTPLLGLFYKGATTEELLQDFSADKNTTDLSLLVSTSEDMNTGEVKVLVSVAEEFYHFFVDTLPLILKIHRGNSGVRFVLYLQRVEYNKQYEDFLVLLFGILDGEGVKYTSVSTVADQDFAPVYLFSNYIAIDKRTFDINDIVTMVDVKYAASVAVLYSNIEDIDPALEREPTKKVYLSRGGRGGYSGSIDAEYKYFQDDLRMHNESELEAFFSERGYEIIEPETKFKTIMEQIDYMRQVKTLVSVTSSGLTNMLFMKPNQTVIEIQVEVVDNEKGVELDGRPEFIQRLHPFYQVLSFIGDHTFLSLPSRRDPQAVIDKIDSSALSYLI
jgi:hypothetical protein